MTLSRHCTRASEDAGIYKMLSRCDALKGTTRKVRRVTPSFLLWNKFSRAKNLEHHSPLLTYIQRAPITWQLQSGTAGCQNHVDRQPVALFLLSDLSYFNKCLYAKKKELIAFFQIKRSTRSLNLYSMCKRRLTSIVPRSIHLGAWVTFCREHMQLMKKLICWRAQMTTKQMD